MKRASNHKQRREAKARTVELDMPQLVWRHAEQMASRNECSVDDFIASLIDKDVESLKSLDREQKTPRTSGPVYTITLTPAMSDEWDEMAEWVGVPVEFMLYDTISSELRTLRDDSDYRKDTRNLWLEKKREGFKVPVRVKKG